MLRSAASDFAARRYIVGGVIILGSVDSSVLVAEVLTCQIKH
jgi:hypothetical protein